MILPIVKYGAPVLRQKGARIEAITSEIKELIADMFETMYEAAGIGLAAQQVGRALQLTVIDVREVTDRPSTLELGGQPAEVDSIMPLVLINPEIKPVGELVVGAEGCLSFPEIYAEIIRPAEVEVRAWNAEGSVIEFKAGGLLARAIQHEVDHLNGILFIDRMTPKAKNEHRAAIEELQAQTKAALGQRLRPAGTSDDAGRVTPRRR
ncbi:MAG TPA: peptide deformylase [Methylomirabilota bacterium]|nr:peptide deformylase [Methylomirabilota bacterium]